MNIGGNIKNLKIWIEKAKGDNCELTQREANLLCEGPPIDVANSISNFMNLIMTCIFFSPIIPQSILAALVGSTLIYWVSKYMLLRKNKMPEMFSDLMASFFANFMPWIIFAWAIGYAVFMGKIEQALTYWSETSETHEDLKNLLISKVSRNRPYIAIFVVLLCLIAPIRSI